jgi:hypothetical protein
MHASTNICCLYHDGCGIITCLCIRAVLEQGAVLEFNYGFNADHVRTALTMPGEHPLHFVSI